MAVPLLIIITIIIFIIIIIASFAQATISTQNLLKNSSQGDSAGGTGKVNIFIKKTSIGSNSKPTQHDIVICIKSSFEISRMLRTAAKLSPAQVSQL